MRISNGLLMALCIGLFPACAGAKSDPQRPPVRTVAYVDINRYMGKWFEIASFPQSFQKGCFATTANYSLRDDGKVDVLNECHLDAVDGPLKTAKGKAYVADESTNAKLRVTFFWPFYGDYWVIDLSENYDFAVVGAPGRDYLWILSRTPVMDESTYRGILARVAAQGFDISRLQRTVHFAN